MRKYAFPAVLCMMLLCGCTHAENSAESAAEGSAQTQTAAAVVIPNETETPPETEPPPPAVPEQTPDEILESYADNDPMQFQGGIGGEEHAETPLPEYFTYRFTPESVTMRLAGGNYQAIPYDFSETAAHNGYYYLSDHNKDGYFDLFAPVRYDDSDNIVTAAVFLWIPDTGKFAEEPVMYETPADDTPIKDDSNEE